MSQCIVPNWNLKHQRQEQVEEEEEGKFEEGNRSSSSHHHHHVLINSTNSHLVPMSNYEVAELTWENGQLGMHGLSGLLPTAPTNKAAPSSASASASASAWGRSNDTLESIVHQATISISHNHKQIQNQPNFTTTQSNVVPAAASSGGNWAESSGRLPPASTAAALLKKRVRSELSEHRMMRINNVEDHKGGAEAPSACGSATATFCRDNNDTTIITWPSHQSPPTFKSTNTTTHHHYDSACHDDGISENQDEDREMSRGETGRSHSTRRISRAAAIHNLSERRRRDRINQKMKTLQKMVPNASKTDKASMLDEVIEYLKQLQAQVQMMSMRSMAPAAAAHHQMMMPPLGMQQHLQQMSMLARMGMGVGLGMAGMGMLDINSMGMAAAAAAAAAARNASQSLPPLMHAPATAPPPPFLPPPFLPPHMMAAARGPPQQNSDASSNASVPLPAADPYCAFLAQSMNMELYSKMAALYPRPQMNQTTKTESSPSRSNNVQED